MAGGGGGVDLASVSVKGPGSTCPPHVGKGSTTNTFNTPPRVLAAGLRGLYNNIIHHSPETGVPRLKGGGTL